ncbi:MAG: hemolysin family protein [Chlamydiales bacterium]
MLRLVLYFTISHLISFLCSLFESVLLSCTPTYIALLKKRGSKGAVKLEEMKNHIDRPLAAILTLNTIAHTFGAAGVGAAVVDVFGDHYVALASVILTLTMLYWTEMLPKTFGAIYWKRLAPLFVFPIQIMIVFSYPVVISFNFIARLLARGKKYDRITEEDIRIALEAGARAGVIEEEEQDMVENIFRLGDRRVGMLMLPRVDIDWIDINDPLPKVRDQILTWKQEHYLVCDKEIDKPVGIVQTGDLLKGAWEGQLLDLKSIVVPPLFVHENAHIFELLDSFKKTRKSIALVTDEYGVIQGVIRLSDIMNAIIKDIDQQVMDGSSQVLRVNNRSWIIDGKMPIDEFKEVFHFEALPFEERARYRTVSGLCMNQLGAIPKKGDIFLLYDHRFEVIQVQRRRVEKILMTKRDQFP